jgi:uncharacterized membrane protein YqjE
MFERMRRLGAGVASIAGLRVELFAVELREQFEQWLRVATLAVATIVLGCIGLGFVAVFVTVAFWDRQPLVALGVFALLFLGAAAWCVRQLSVLFATAPEPFAATVAEFRRDSEALDPAPRAAGPASTPAPGEATGSGSPGARSAGPARR